MGPARALQEREKFRKNTQCFVQTILWKVAVFCSPISKHMFDLGRHIFQWCWDVLQNSIESFSHWAMATKLISNFVSSALSSFTDCYLRQGDGGTKLHVLVRELAFWGDFINRSEMYFGHKSEEHVKTLKKTSYGSQKRRFKMLMCLKKNVFP